jgi:hypothetical protein
VPGRDLDRQLGDGLVEHTEVIGQGVGPRVTRPQPGGERLAGRIREAQHQLEAALVLHDRARCRLVR